jgi:hypothetical protein
VGHHTDAKLIGIRIRLHPSKQQNLHLFIMLLPLWITLFLTLFIHCLGNPFPQSPIHEAEALSSPSTTTTTSALDPSIVPPSIVPENHSPSSAFSRSLTCLYSNSQLPAITPSPESSVPSSFGDIQTSLTTIISPELVTFVPRIEIYVDSHLDRPQQLASMSQNLNVRFLFALN